MVSLAFIISFVASAVAMLIGIVIFTEVEDGMVGTFGDPILIQNGTAGGTTTGIMYGCTSDAYGQYIYEVDKTNAVLSNRISHTLNGCGGMSQDPTTGIWYVIGSIGGTTAYLITVDPTGIGNTFCYPTAIPDNCHQNYIGSTAFPHIAIHWRVGNNVTDGQIDSGSGDKVRTMNFDGDGNLFAFAPHSTTTLLSIDKTTGEDTSVCDVATNEKQHIAWNYDTDEMYLFGEDTGKFRVIDTSTCAESSDIVISPAITGQLDGFAYNTVDGLFYVSTHNGLHTLNTDGDSTFIDQYDVGARWFLGLAFATETTVGQPAIYEGGVPESFTSASSIALTVLGVLPVALFFALFTILSGRTGE